MNNGQMQIIRGISMAESLLSDLEDLVRENSLSFNNEWKIGDCIEKVINEITSAVNLLKIQDEEEEEEK